MFHFNGYQFHTLVYRIDVQYEINVQVGKFLKNIKRAGQNRRAGGIFFFSKSINVQTKIRPCSTVGKTVTKKLFIISTVCSNKQEKSMYVNVHSFTYVARTLASCLGICRIFFF